MATLGLPERLRLACGTFLYRNWIDAPSSEYEVDGGDKSIDGYPVTGRKMAPPYHHQFHHVWKTTPRFTTASLSPTISAADVFIWMDDEDDEDEDDFMLVSEAGKGSLVKSIRVCELGGKVRMDL